MDGRLGRHGYTTRVTQSHLQEMEEQGIGDMCGTSCNWSVKHGTVKGES